MHTKAGPSVAPNSAPRADFPAVAESISLHRDPQSEEWVFDLSPGLDLVEVARVLNVVQQRALQLLQQQMYDAQSVAARASMTGAAQH